MIEPAIQKLGLVLTVIPAYGYVTDTLKVGGIPQICRRYPNCTLFLTIGLPTQEVAGYTATRPARASTSSARTGKTTTGES